MRKHDYCAVLTAHGDSNHASLNCITHDHTALTWCWIRCHATKIFLYSVPCWMSIRVTYPSVLLNRISRS